MTDTSNAARLRIMNTPSHEPTPRERALLARIHKHGIADMSEREAARVLNVDRATYGRLEDGLKMNMPSLAKMEKGLDDYVAEHGLEEGDQPSVSTIEPQEPEVFQLTISIGALDLKVTASGRPQDADIIREQVERAVVDLMREAKG